MDSLIISPKIENKILVKHGVTATEVCECFMNREGKSLVDDAEEHRTDPPTQWFLAKTNHNRQLKIIFIIENGKLFLKSAFEPSQADCVYYYTHAY